jgi:hypothetical protein
MPVTIFCLAKVGVTHFEVFVVATSRTAGQGKIDDLQVSAKMCRGTASDVAFLSAADATWRIIADPGRQPDGASLAFIEEIGPWCFPGLPIHAIHKQLDFHCSGTPWNERPSPTRSSPGLGLPTIIVERQLSGSGGLVESSSGQIR